MRILRIGLMVLLAVLWAGAGWAAQAPVPQTGQILCYDESGFEIFCRGTGQDGDLQEGVSIPTPRYTDKGDGTIKDNLTGLIWLKNANCSNTHRFWFQGPLDDVKNLNSTGKMNDNDCGDTSGKRGSHRTDWRLPNVRELFSLVDFAFTSPAISNAAGTGQGSSNDPFTNFQASAYWSSTTNDYESGFEWVVSFGSGNVTNNSKRFNSGYVIAVRGGS